MSTCKLASSAVPKQVRCIRAMFRKLSPPADQRRQHPTSCLHRTLSYRAARSVEAEGDWEAAQHGQLSDSRHGPRDAPIFSKPAVMSVGSNVSVTSSRLMLMDSVIKSIKIGLQISFSLVILSTDPSPPLMPGEIGDVGRTCHSRRTRGELSNPNRLSVTVTFAASSGGTRAACPAVRREKLKSSRTQKRTRDGRALRLANLDGGGAKAPLQAVEGSPGIFGILKLFPAGREHFLRTEARFSRQRD